MFENIDTQKRKIWREARVKIKDQLIRNGQRSSIFGHRALPPSITHQTFNLLVNILGLSRRGKRNAKNININKIRFNFSNLPSSFNGYTILHLSDLHVGKTEALECIIQEKLFGLHVDLVVITGDYQTLGKPKGDFAASILESLMSNVHSEDGWISVLGNHDNDMMLDRLENLGIRVLVNETIKIVRDQNSLHFVGTDDVVGFFTQEAINTLRAKNKDFRIALVHSPDLATIAAEEGCSLYLTGHTHGGQVCLPGGRPVFTALDSHRHLARGKWRVLDMVGYTNTGLGTSNCPYRFNCPGEAALIRLVKLL